MNGQKEELFISEINTMLDFCFHSFHKMNETLIKMGNNEKVDKDYFWFYSQDFITYAANISKLLWATKSSKENYGEFKKRKEFRDSLRLVLGVSDKSILKNKKLRNRFEHLDEDLDGFKSNVVMSKNFGPVKDFMIFDGENYDLTKEKQLRHYNPYTKILYLYGEKMNLQELYNEIKSLSEKVDKYEEERDGAFYPFSQRSKLRSNLQNGS